MGAVVTADCPVRRAARERPQARALTWTAGEPVALSYASLDRAVEERVAWLVGLGVREGERVAVVSENRPELVEVFHAAGRLGACLVPVNARLTQAELAPLLERAGARLVLRSLDAARRGGERGRDEAAPSPSSQRSAAGERPRCALFTSGTTGTPRLVELTHANFDASARASGANLGAGPDQRWLCTLPLFHVGALAMAHRTAAMGAELVLEPGFDAARVSDWLEAGVTHASLVPTTLARLLDARGDRPFPPTVRAVLIGGGPMAPELLARARRAGLPVLQTYGLTEACSQVCTERPGEADGATAGHPLPGLEVRVVEGELHVRGRTVAPALGPWLRTGDLGSLDARGRLTVHARRDDLILSGGENVSPAEIEAALAAHPDVAEVAVVPAEDAQWGQVPVAVVAWRAAASPGPLVAWARGRLAPFKLPRRVVSVAALPRTATGKVDRRAARALACNRPPDRP